MIIALLQDITYRKWAEETLPTEHQIPARSGAYYPSRLDWAESIIRKYYQETSILNVLDYGCGTGGFLYELNKRLKFTTLLARLSAKSSRNVLDAILMFGVLNTFSDVFLQLISTVNINPCADIKSELYRSR